MDNKIISFRAMRKDEVEGGKLEQEGINALAPGCTRYTVQQHIRREDLKTRFISASKNPLSGVTYLDGKPFILVGIMASWAVDAEAAAEDLFPEKPETGRRSPAYYYTKKSHEVIYVDHIDADDCVMLVDGRQWPSPFPTAEERALVADFCDEAASCIDRRTGSAGAEGAILSLSAQFLRALDSHRLDVASALAHLAVSLAVRQAKH